MFKNKCKGSAVFIVEIAPFHLHGGRDEFCNVVSGHMAFGVLEFNEQMERMGELTIVILLGAMISREHFIRASFYMVPFLLLVARPLSVFIGLGPIKNSHKIRALVAVSPRGKGTKISALTEAHGLPIGVEVFPANMNGKILVEPLLSGASFGLPKPKNIIGNAQYNSKAMNQRILKNITFTSQLHQRDTRFIHFKMVEG